MARLPNIKGDRDNWGAVLNDYLDVGHHPDGRLRDVDVPPAFAALDIWDGFDATGAASGSWDALTYAGYIAGIDAMLAAEISSGRVDKADLGVASDDTSHVFSYTAGDGPIEVLLIAGAHGAEIHGQYASMRWFQQFVTSEHMDCRRMRNAYRVTWIPTLNPAAYRAGRKNANDVDINRNSDLFWARYSVTDPGDPAYKGPSVASEPETQMIATLLATHDYRCIFDCHNYGDDGDSFKIGLPGAHLLGPRGFGEGVYDRWRAVYGSGITTDYLNLHNTQPTLVEYGNYVIRHLNGHGSTGALLIECSQNLFGSLGPNDGSATTRAAVRAYAGMIHTYLLALMEQGGKPTAEPYAYSYAAVQTSDITIETSDPVYMTLATSVGEFVPNMDRIPVPVAFGPAWLLVDASGYMASTGGSTRTELRIEIDGDSRSFWRCSVSTTENTGDAIPWSVKAAKWYDGVSNETVPEVRFVYDLITGSPMPALRRTNLRIQVIPDTLTHPAPRVNGIP